MREAPTVAGRLRAIDWLRGIVMVLMAIDHASAIYNAERIASDNAVMHVVGSALPPEQLFTRWITHLCAPAFVLLAGMSIALAGARLGGPEERRRFDRHLMIRGVVLVALDAVYMSGLSGGLLLQVLYALGVGMFALAFLRPTNSQPVGLPGVQVAAKFARDPLPGLENPSKLH